MLSCRETVKSGLVASLIFFLTVISVSAQDNISYIKNLSAQNTPNRGVIISWNTKYNDTTALFIVERSIDGQNFEKLGEVNSINTQTNFKFIDRKPYADVSYYRLQVVDYDGKRFTSGLTSTYIPTEKKPEVVLYPMPVGNANTLNLNFKGIEKDFKAMVTITDQFGRQVLIKEIEVSNLNNINTLDFKGNLPAGNYQMTIVGHSGQSFKIGKLLQIVQ